MANYLAKKKYFSKYKKSLIDFPNLIENQVKSYNSFLEEGLKKIFQEFSPIEDYSKKKFSLEFVSFYLKEPEYDEIYAKENRLSYEREMRVKIRLINKIQNTSREQEVFLTYIPMITNHGTFILNGVERVFVMQLTRSYGAIITQDEEGSNRFGAKIIPARGIWIEIKTENDNAIYVSIDKKRKFPVTDLLRALGVKEAEIKKIFSENDYEKEIIQNTLSKSLSPENDDEVCIDIYKRLRNGELATAETAREYLKSLLSPEKYDLSEVGRFRLNACLCKVSNEKDFKRTTINVQDLIDLIKYILKLNQTPGAKPDDIDSLGQRRVRLINELFEQRFRIGMAQIKRNVQDKMSIAPTNTYLPSQVFNPRPLQARIREFFLTNQLSQFMNQENSLAEMENIRTLSALGTGGLTRERAGLEVRDVHISHYGRICPIHTPEGVNIGLITHLSLFSRINPYGLIETPYIRVKNGRITKEIVYLTANEEERYNIAHAAINYNEKGEILDKVVEGRKKLEPGFIPREKVDFIEVAPYQSFSLATCLIPFLEHDDANRALMGSNMQKQAVPCVRREAPLVATGLEDVIARNSGRLIICEEDGIVTYVDNSEIIVKNKRGQEKKYSLVSFLKTNNFNNFQHFPIVKIGDKVSKGDVLADFSCTYNGQLALGQNVLVAFLSWYGSNYEDAIVISERLVKNNVFSSIHIEEFVCDVRETKLGPETVTRDIPNVSEAKLKNLDEEGIIRIGSEVNEGDILVGKITPKGEVDLTPEERLLRAIFAEKAKEVKDTSLRLEHGKRGRVIRVKVFSKENGYPLETGVIKRIVVEIAQLRNITVGDKLSGRHGNKGIISVILPEEDMPYMADGTPIDIVLTPLGVPSRMNLGQILEMHLGLAANTLKYQAIVPPFCGATEEEIKDELKKAGLPEDGKITLYDGKTGEPFAQKVAYGYMYMLKLHHMVEDKIHARSIGSYSLITQQPLGGKSQGGGQRFGEMEVWALEGYSAAYTLQELLTIKSDDVIGRVNAFESIIHNKELEHFSAPSSFKVMLNYLRGLALNPQLNFKSKKTKKD